jgi:membrane-associated phospholipid phosphatase
MKIQNSFLAAIALVTTLSAQVEPKAGQWKTWVIPSGSAYRLPAPPDAAGSAEEIEWLKLCAANRTQAILAQIRYWDAGAPGYRWMQVTQQMAVSAGLPTPMQTRALALVAAAIYDTTIATWDSKYTYMRKRPSEMDPTLSTVVPGSQSPSYPSEHAATAGAAAAVLVYLFPDQAAAIAGMADQAAQSRILAGAEFPSDVDAGKDLGNLVGQAVIAYAKTDGSNQQFTGSFTPATGIWGSPNPVAPLAGTWKTWVLNSASQFRPGAPPAFNSADANGQYAAVKNLQATNATNHSAWFWQPGFFQPWLQQDETQIFQYHLDGNAPRAARVYALQSIAQHDATLACWDAKYMFLELRPSQADSTIVPLFALPQHPGYPSGHACGSGASAGVLAYVFPADATALNAMATDGGTSTFDARIHTQLDVTTGLALGGQVAQAVVARAQADGSQ